MLALNETKSKIVVLTGPTASGKTTLSLNLAAHFNLEIVSADSIQIYRYMDIGSAKPTFEERSAVPHHMIDIRFPDEDFTAGDYVREARSVINNIIGRGRQPLVVGGAGLYIRLLLRGIAEIPIGNPGLRERFKAEEAATPGILHGRLGEVDPEAQTNIPAGNVARLIRALEIIELSGMKFSEIRRKHAFNDRPYDHLIFCVNTDRPELYARIDKRVDGMINDGLLEEYESLSDRGYSSELKSMQSLGYRHAGLALSGNLPLVDAVALMKRDTRKYAKRQFTWFRSEPGVVWVAPSQIKELGTKVANFLGSK